jgi:alpha-ribazole phosphatase
MKVYLVRHGESEANASKVFSGHIDVELSSKGVEEAMALSSRLGSVSFDKVYSSDLKRAKRTAELILSENSDMEVWQELREMNFGIFENHTFESMAGAFPEEFAHWSKDFLNNTPPEGESMISMYRRVNDAYCRIIDEGRRERHDNILIVAHSGVIRSIMAGVLAGDPGFYFKVSVDNCKINVIEHEERKGGKLIMLNA